MARQPSAVLAGPGYLFYADASSAVEAAPTAAPADPSTDPAGNWEDAGYTDDGVAFEWDLGYEDIEVAESATPLRTLWTEAEYRLVAVLAQFELETLQLALNGGTITPITGPPVERSFAPPTIGNDHAWSILFQFSNENAAGSFLYMQLAKNTASASIPFTKAPQKSTIAIEMTAQVPDSGNIWDLREYVSAS